MGFAKLNARLPSLDTFHHLDFTICHCTASQQRFLGNLLIIPQFRLRNLIHKVSECCQLIWLIWANHHDSLLRTATEWKRNEVILQKDVIKASRNLISNQKDEEMDFNCLWGSLRTKGLLSSLRYAFSFLFWHLTHQPACSALILSHPLLLWFLDTIPCNFQSVHAMKKVCPSVYSFQNKLGKALESNILCRQKNHVAKCWLYFQSI